MCALNLPDIIMVSFIYGQWPLEFEASLVYLLITYIGKFHRTNWLRTRQLNPIEKKATKMADRSRKSNKVLKQSLKESAENRLKKKFNFLKTKRIVPKVIYCLRYCFLLTKDCMHNEVWGCAETLPVLTLQHAKSFKSTKVGVASRDFFSPLCAMY